MQLNLNISGYEGPLDLLLELSKKQKVDIKKISILELANQYLEFIDKNLNYINLSADYLVMASVLAFWKSKMLLPEDQKSDVDEIEEDLTARLIHYDAIRKLASKIFELPQEGKDFKTISVRNDYSISSKLVPKVFLQDLILKYSFILKQQKTIKIIADETDLYSIEDGLRWLKEIFQIKEKNWLSLFDFLPSDFTHNKKKKSAIVSLLLASLNEAFQGKVIINQKYHFEKIMIKKKI